MEILRFRRLPCTFGMQCLDGMWYETFIMQQNGIRIVRHLDSRGGRSKDQETRFFAISSMRDAVARLPAIHYHFVCIDASPLYTRALPVLTKTKSRSLAFDKNTNRMSRQPAHGGFCTHEAARQEVSEHLCTSQLTSWRTWTPAERRRPMAGLQHLQPIGSFVRTLLLSLPLALCDRRSDVHACACRAQVRDVGFRLFAAPFATHDDRTPCLFRDRHNMWYGTYVEVSQSLRGPNICHARRLVHFPVLTWTSSEAHMLLTAHCSVTRSSRTLLFQQLVDYTLVITPSTYCGSLSNTPTSHFFFCFLYLLSSRAYQVFNCQVFTRVFITPAAQCSTQEASLDPTYAQQQYQYIPTSLLPGILSSSSSFYPIPIRNNFGHWRRTRNGDWVDQWTRPKRCNQSAQRGAWFVRHVYVLSLTDCQIAANWRKKKKQGWEDAVARHWYARLTYTYLEFSLSLVEFLRFLS